MIPATVMATYVVLGFVAGLMAGVALNWKFAPKLETRR